MGSISIVHWAAVLLVVILVFGTKKLGNIGSDLGKAVKGFKDGVKGEDATIQAQGEHVQPAQLAQLSQRTTPSSITELQIDEASRNGIGG